MKAHDILSASKIFIFAIALLVICYCIGYLVADGVIRVVPDNSIKVKLQQTGEVITASPIYDCMEYAPGDTVTLYTMTFDSFVASDEYLPQATTHEIDGHTVYVLQGVVLHH